MNVSKTFYFLILLSFVFTSCQLFFGEDDKLTLNRESYHGKKLRFDGYYYEEYQPNYYNLLFIFQNGVVMSGGGTHKDDLSKLEEYFVNPKFLENRQKNKIGWGVFNIIGDSIKYERWYPGEKPYRTAIREGIILNDTTFVIKKSIMSSNKIDVENEIFHFRKFEYKPDSISQFIK